MNYWLLLPEFALVSLAFIVFSADLFLPRDRKDYLVPIAALGLLGIMGIVIARWGDRGPLYNGLFLVDGYALFFKLFFLALGFFIVLSAAEFVRKNLAHPGEFYGLILLSVLAMMLMAASGELIMAYISLELSSFSLYILTAYAKEDLKSNEAGVKFILLGAFSSAILLYGLSLLYGILGTTNFETIAQALEAGMGIQPGLLVALVLVIAGLGFKIAAVPFHMWAPDVYEGAPLPVTAYLAVASKAAGLALLLRLFTAAFLPAMEQWQGIIVVLAAVTITLGNLVAIPQKNIKRLLAYSSIGQVGYLLMGVAVLTPLAVQAVAFHLVGYAASTLAAFICIIAYFNFTRRDEIPQYAGLAERAPFLALVLSVSFFSLAGLPFFAGFTTKFYLFTAAAKGGLLWLVTLAIVNSLISLYYYLLVIKQMYISPAQEAGRLPLSPTMKGVLGMLFLAIIFIGVYPQPLLRLIASAAQALFAG